MKELIVFILIMHLGHFQNILVNLSDSQSVAITNIYNPTTKLNKNFSSSILTNSNCGQVYLYYINFTSQINQNIIQIKNLNDQPIVLQNIQLVGSQNYILNPYWTLEQPLSPQIQYQFVFDMHCPEVFNSQNYWQSLQVNLEFNDQSQNIQFEYITVCNIEYKPSRFDWAQIILIAVCLILIYIFSKFQKIKSLEFVGIIIKWWYAIILSVIIFLAVIVTLEWYKDIKILIDILVILLSSCFSFFFINEIIYFFPATRQKIIKFIRIQDLISIVITALLILWFILSNNSWYVTNIISIMLIGSLLKLFKFNNMKNATIFLTICFVCEIGQAIYVILNKNINQYDGSIIQELNTPFQIQVPSFSPLLFKKCNWISVTGIIFPGWFISYMMRIDKSDFKKNNSQIFTLMSYFGFVIGSIVWLIVTIFYDQAIPFALTSYFLMISITLIIAYLRADLIFIWEGNFNDNELEKNLIKKELEQKAQEENEALRYSKRDSWKQLGMKNLRITDNKHLSSQQIISNRETQEDHKSLDQSRRKSQKIDIKNEEQSSKNIQYEQLLQQSSFDKEIQLGKSSEKQIKFEVNQNQDIYQIAENQSQEQSQKLSTSDKDNKSQNQKEKQDNKQNSNSD